MSERPYYKDHVVYQIYPRSFCDSNGDGIGDLKGIISKLDYLQDLGADILWLSPVYPSPNVDFGYDISDYKAINPEYGTMEDFEELVAEARKRGMKIVMDLVVNHTSSKHPWFIQSKDRNSKYHDYYIYAKGRKNNKKPPNNWVSNFMSEAWTYVPECEEWYLHLFTEDQCDLNWKNPLVLQEVESILEFWYSKGVYGFRCDVINEIYKTSLADGKGTRLNRYRGGEHYFNQEGNHKILQKLRKEVFSKHDTMVVGECPNSTLDDARKFTTEELDMVFAFEHQDSPTYKLRPWKFRPFDAERWKRIFIRWQESSVWNAVYLENHDQLRSIDHFGEREYWKECGKLYATLLLTLKGTPFIFEGEEIGMLDYDHYDLSKSRDIVADNVKRILDPLPLTKKTKENIISHYCRDHERMPMRFDSGKNYGFSSSDQTWLPVTDEHPDINVRNEENDPESILNYYKSLLRFRKQSQALRGERITFIEKGKGVLAYYREEENEKLLIILNLNNHIVNGNFENESVLFFNYSERDEMHLEPYECRVIKVN